jgi:hypothetical protein
MLTQKKIGFLFYLIVFCLLSFTLKSQTFEESEIDLFNLFEKISASENDSTKVSLNNTFSTEFQKVLTNSESFDYDFAKLNKISRVFADDGKARFYTWALRLSDGNYKFFGFCQYKQKKEIFVFPLQDHSDDIPNPENAVLSPANWYGALYYAVVVKKAQKQTCYTLLAWDGNDNFTNKKLIDVFFVTKEGVPHFGAPILQYRKQMQNRIIFEFGEQVNMVLRWDPDYKMIIWDHLAPSKKQFEGQFQYYGPDFSYDALVFKKGFWNFVEKFTPLNKDTKPSNKEIKYGY